MEEAGLEFLLDAVDRFPCVRSLQTTLNTQIRCLWFCWPTAGQQRWPLLIPALALAVVSKSAAKGTVLPLLGFGGDLIHPPRGLRSPRTEFLAGRKDYGWEVHHRTGPHVHSE